MQDFAKASFTNNSHLLREHVLVTLFYVLATALATPHYMGDTTNYAGTITDWSIRSIWEFGHLLWFPLGWLFSKITFPLTRIIYGDVSRTNALLALIILNWIAGLVCVLAIQMLAQRATKRGWIVWLVVAGFTFTNGFLNYTQTGCSYVPGLAFLLVSLCLSTRPQANMKSLVLSGAALALALCLWLPYVLAAPAAIAAPLLLLPTRGSPISALRARWKQAAVVAISGGLATLGIYFLAALAMGVHDLTGLRAWMAEVSHGAMSKGLTRMIFGFARSFINMGDDGILFKRFMLHDPYSPVTVADLIRLSIGKLVLFYAFLAAIVIGLISKREWYVLTFLAISAIPVLAFAIGWQGGDMERYLAFYPALFVALAYALNSTRAKSIVRICTLMFIVIASLVNAAYMSLPAAQARESGQYNRVAGLALLWQKNDALFVSHLQEGLYGFNNDYPFHAFNRNNNFRVLEITSPNVQWSRQWQSAFATNARRVWDDGGRVWISKRVLKEQPRPEWNWVEGADETLSWTQLNKFFQQFEYGQSVGGENGFVLLPNSARNREALPQNPLN